MAVAAKLYWDHRSAERHAVELDGTLRDADLQPHDTTIEDLSATGFRTPAVTGLQPGQVISLGLAGVGMRRARVVHEHDGRYGCEFLDPLSGTELGLAIAAEPRTTVAVHPQTVAGFDLRHAPEPVVELYSRRVRGVVAAGLVVVTWAAVIWVATALL